MPRSISRVVLLCGLLVLATAFGGCQSGPTWTLVPVEGTVTKGGRPLANVQVIFLADPDAGTVGPRASGTTDAAGHYRLRTDNGDEGAVAGQHRVRIVDWQTNPNMPAELRRVPPHYESFKETPLRAEVGSVPKVFDISIP